MLDCDANMVLRYVMSKNFKAHAQPMTSPVVQPSQNGVTFFDNIRKSSTLNVSFSC